MAPFYRGYDPVFRLDSDDIQVTLLKYGRCSRNVLTSFDNYRVFKHYMVENHLVVVPLVVVEKQDQDHQPKLPKLQQYYVMMMLYAKTLKLMPSSIQLMVQLLHSRVTSITNSQRTQLLMVIQKQSLKAGLDYQTILMLHLLTKMAKHISSKEPNTGDTMDAIWMVNIQKISVKDLLVFQTILMLLWYGEEMAKFTSIKAASSGDLIHLSDHQLKQHILNQSVIGKEFQITLMLPYNTPMDIHISSKETNITDLMTEHLL